ncbi:MarR family winged helix-turn-helix transcriptional regulator [Nocardia jiangxiensis]|uniref:MarR family winged helix-turn-helix transcriptional regulator n=1 Tax=Nocardia jiangxiensis TaxID=282685 RepID=UPI0005950A75|nr:MarR family transcriptional regulator [Nocardia jiangxiensis]
MQVDEEPGGESRPDVAALEVLTRTLVGIAWDSAHVAPPGVTFPQMRLLLVLQTLGRVPCSRLATALGVNASSVTRLADKLESRGFLSRGADAHNRSVVTVEVTEAGQQVVDEVLEARHAAFRIILDQLPEEKRQSVTAAAHDLVRAAAETSVSLVGAL